MSVCNGGGCCQGGACVANNANCAMGAGQCRNSSCGAGACGVIGQPCCMGGGSFCSGPNTLCVNAVCQGCGGKGERACLDIASNQFLLCDPPYVVTAMMGVNYCQ